MKDASVQSGTDGTASPPAAASGVAAGAPHTTGHAEADGAGGAGEASVRREHSAHGYSGHGIYEEMHASEEFQELRRRYRAFAIPATAVFLGWYLLYVVLSSWAGSFMSLRVVGNINVALILGLLQFASTFAIAWAYARHANGALDPIAGRLERHYKKNGSS